MFTDMILGTMMIPRTGDVLAIGPGAVLAMLVFLAMAIVMVAGVAGEMRPPAQARRAGTPGGAFSAQAARLAA